ncbi:thiosulfate oxidation carrier complex protein SoxZ [Ideonella livida]|uniref:Thiosulfate oxidation carrier complex protein SoxZ n=1 Tax=Ideonella livida TaxID=2707176 RepID=A0A7C9TKH2_9BURK|nr:thiosulfate oxidation carrier complex protein SoxZ [Ideonella livida]NDY92819.1 thiosulfate oxidation carrier complex protein SoxZ [Ideonella livida]
MSEADTPAVLVRAQWSATANATTVRVLMRHAMENGLRRDAAGAPVPAWFIQEVRATLNGQEVLRAHWGPSVARHPFLQFSLLAARPGDRVQVAWTDNRGATGLGGATVA